MKYLPLLVIIFPLLVNAQDTTAPVVSNFWSSDTVMVAVNTDFNKQIPAYKITDDKDGDITSKAVVNNTVHEDSVGYYLFSVAASDAAGNTTTVKATIHVADTTAPQIALNGKAFAFIPLNSDYTDAGVWTADNYYPTDQLAVKAGGTYANSGTMGRYCVYYSAVDPSGNESPTVQRTLCVGLDSLACISLPGDWCSATVGIQEASASFIKFYPNPSSGILHIQTTEKISGLAVFDAQGRLVYHETKPGAAIQISLIRSGIYMAKFYNESGQLFFNKIIVD